MIAIKPSSTSSLAISGSPSHFSARHGLGKVSKIKRVSLGRNGGHTIEHFGLVLHLLRYLLRLVKVEARKVANMGTSNRWSASFHTYLHPTQLNFPSGHASVQELGGHGLLGARKSWSTT